MCPDEQAGTCDGNEHLRPPRHDLDETGCPEDCHADESEHDRPCLAMSAEPSRERAHRDEQRYRREPSLDPLVGEQPTQPGRSHQGRPDRAVHRARSRDDDANAVYSLLQDSCILLHGRAGRWQRCFCSNPFASAVRLRYDWLMAASVRVASDEVVDVSRAAPRVHCRPRHDTRTPHQARDALDQHLPALGAIRTRSATTYGQSSNPRRRWPTRNAVRSLLMATARRPVSLLERAGRTVPDRVR